MDGSAPKEVLQYVDEQDRQAHEVIATESTKAGYPITASDVNSARGDSHLEDIRDLLEKTAGHLSSSVGSQGSSTYVETAPGHRVAALLRGKLRLKKRIGSLFHRK